MRTVYNITFLRQGTGVSTFSVEVDKLRKLFTNGSIESPFPGDGPYAVNELVRIERAIG